ncbi:MAG: hypothetical protein UCV58_05940, partial [Clostridium saudiense]|nr:hypothetical protein [Clostridium saudiense]
SLTFKDEIINYNFIENLKEEYTMYLNLLDITKEEEERISIKEEKLIDLKAPLRSYYYMENLPENILSNLEALKIKNELLNEKVEINNSIESEINFLKVKEKEAQKLIGSAIEIKNFKSDIEKLFATYEDKLKSLKFIMENKNEVIVQNTRFLILLGVVSLISIILGIFINNPFEFIFYTIGIVILGFLGINLYSSKLGSEKNKTTHQLNESIRKIEAELNKYCNKLNVSNYTELLKKLKVYDDYLSLQEKINSKMSEKLTQKKLLSLDKALREHEEVNSEIEEYLRISSLNSLEKLISEIYKYKELSKGFTNLEIELSNLKNSLNRTKEQLLIREEKLNKSLSSIGFNNVNLVDVDEIIKELENKLRKRDEINKSLASVEEAYSVLTRGKDIEAIKEELSDVININFDYSYENEDEIDDVIREKNIRFVEVEKKIKDIENEIKNRFNGKRDIPTIEEEIKEVESYIAEYENQLKASNITSEILNEVYNEIRGSFGPILNKNVMYSFKELTNNKYNDVMVSDTYEMKVKADNNILPAEILSNGANDQLYLSLRLAFIEMIFKNK